MNFCNQPRTAVRGHALDGSSWPNSVGNDQQPGQPQPVQAVSSTGIRSHDCWRRRACLRPSDHGASPARLQGEESRAAKSQASIDEGATVFERCRAAGSIHSVCRHMELAGEGSVLAAASSSRLCLEGSALYLATWPGQKRAGTTSRPLGLLDVCYEASALGPLPWDGRTSLAAMEAGSLRAGEGGMGVEQVSAWRW